MRSEVIADCVAPKWPRHRSTDDKSLKTSIIMKHVTAIWNSDATTNPTGIFNVNTELTHGLCVVMGSVGAGKTTLLNVILGEMAIAGECVVNGRVSYASQEPWLFEGSIRDNIVFVDDFDEQRYRDVIRVCALHQDFRFLLNGDRTIVGENGTSLSGGQKARVNLARAIYRQADIYLLDDPLSAVDANVGRHIFEKCVEEYLHDKLCVLVTHQLQYLERAKHIIVMNKGYIDAQGNYRTLFTEKIGAKNEKFRETKVDTVSL